MATVGCSADDLGAPGPIDRLHTGDSEEPSRSRSDRNSRDGDEKDEGESHHRESVCEDNRESAQEAPGSPEEMRPSEVIRVNSEIDSFVNRNRQASVAHVKLRPQASSMAHLTDHQPELYDVVTAATARRNSILAQDAKSKDETSVESGNVSPSHVNVARLSMSVAAAKAKLDGIKIKSLDEDGSTGGEKEPKLVSPKAKSGAVAEEPKAAPEMGLPKQSSLHMNESESLAMNKQRQAANTMQRKELMTGKPEGKDDDDNEENRVIKIVLPATFAPSARAVPPPPTKLPVKPIIKPCPQQYNGLAALQKQEAYIASIMDRMKVAAKFMKYNLQGKPNSRYFYITEDGTELHWTKTNPAKGRNHHSLTAEKPRKRYFADVRGVYYGPYNNRRVFRRFLDNKDQFEGSGKDWLCITVAFDDRTLDFCCTTDEQVSTWFMCMQALAPRAASYLTCGSVLWRRLIMKLNAYGLDPSRWPGPLQDHPAVKGKRK